MDKTGQGESGQQPKDAVGSDELTVAEQLAGPPHEGLVVWGHDKRPSPSVAQLRKLGSHGQALIWQFLQRFPTFFRNERIGVECMLELLGVLLHDSEERFNSTTADPTSTICSTNTLLQV
jgi:hypothetical protein